MKEKTDVLQGTLALFSMMDRINKRLEDVQLSVRTADELRGTRTTYSVCNRRSSAFIGDLFDGFLRAKIPSRGDGDHLQESCSWKASFLRRCANFIWGLCLSNLRTEL